MGERLKIGDHYEYDFGDGDWSFPTESVIMYINGDVAVMKVISMSAECEELTLKYDDVLEYFPDFSDPEQGFYSRYLFLDLDTSWIIPNLDAYYYEKEYHESDDEELAATEPIQNEVSQNTDNEPNIETSSDDLPF